MMRKTVIGVMGPGNNSEELAAAAHEMGKLIAQREWVLLTGGRRAGVMDAASKGASEAGGLVVGVLPDDDDHAISPFVDIAIRTGMGSARNNINVLSSDVVIACGLGSGTASEISLALKAGKYVVLLSIDPDDCRFFERLGGNKVLVASDPKEAETIVAKLLDRNKPPS